MTNELGPDTWLFRFRWFVPLLLVPLAILAALQADTTGVHLGRSLNNGWEILCLLIVLGGLAIRALAVGFSPGAHGRAADSELPSRGIYSIVRYPLFLGTYISLLGVSLLPGAIWFVLVMSALFFIWYGRLVQQTETALAQRFGDAYRQWAARIPMFVPNPMLWRRPGGSFSLSRVLQRERNDFYFLVAGFVGLELACDILGEHQPVRQWLREDAHWVLLLVIATLLYGAIRLLSPRSEALAVAPAAAPHGGYARGPATRGLRVDGRVRAVDTLENMLSGGNLEGILHATLAAAELRSGDRMVDVGCGTGALAMQAATLRPDGRAPLGEVVGIDATPGMIDIALQRAREAGSTARFEVGTAEALPFADGALDALTSSYFFHHLPSDLKRDVLYEMWRVLKPGGRLVVSDYSRPSSFFGWIASFPMRFDFHEYVRGQLSGELEALLRGANLGRVEVVRVFLGYITVYRIVKTGRADP